MSVNNDFIHVPALPVVVLGCRFDLPALAMDRTLAIEVLLKGPEAMGELRHPNAFICNAFWINEFEDVVCGALGGPVIDRFLARNAEAFDYRARLLHSHDYRRKVNGVRRLWAQHILDHIEETFPC